MIKLDARIIPALKAEVIENPNLSALVRDTILDIANHLSTHKTVALAMVDVKSEMEAMPLFRLHNEGDVMRVAGAGVVAQVENMQGGLRVQVGREDLEGQASFDFDQHFEGEPPASAPGV